MRRTEVTIAACTLLLGAACAWVPLDPGAEAVAVRSLDEVAACERLGKTGTRTLDHVGPVARRESKIEEELANLARNEAVRMGGNAVAPLEPTVVDGERRFGIYRCP